MRLKIFVHSLLLALCSFGISTVLAAIDSQKNIKTISEHEVTIEVAGSASAGAQTSSIFISRQASEPGQGLLVAAAQKDSAKQASSQKSSKPKYENFQELDVEAEDVLREVLDLSSDLAIIDEQHSNPPKNQLMVLVTLQPSKFFELDYVELKIDNEMVAAHSYSDNDVGALVRGGGHRLYLANLPAGTHELEAKFIGGVPRDPDYQREAKFKFISGVNRTLIELYINGGESGGFPQFTVREWD